MKKKKKKRFGAPAPLHITVTVLASKTDITSRGSEKGYRIQRVGGSPPRGVLTKKKNKAAEPPAWRGQGSPTGGERKIGSLPQ